MKKQYWKQTLNSTLENIKPYAIILFLGKPGILFLYSNIQSKTSIKGRENASARARYDTASHVVNYVE